MIDSRFMPPKYYEACSDELRILRQKGTRLG